MNVLSHFYEFQCFICNSSNEIVRSLFGRRLKTAMFMWLMVGVRSKLWSPRLIVEALRVPQLISELIATYLKLWLKLLQYKTTKVIISFCLYSSLFQIWMSKSWLHKKWNVSQNVLQTNTNGDFILRQVLRPKFWRPPSTNLRKVKFTCVVKKVAPYLTSPFRLLFFILLYESTILD